MMSASRLTERGVARDRHDTRGGDAVGRERAQHSLYADERSLADGEIAWSWRPDAGAKFRGDDPVDDGG